MTGLLKSELENGKAYTCNLSKRTIIVEIRQGVRGQNYVGLYYDLNDGYKTIEIFDGQLARPAESGTSK